MMSSVSILLSLALLGLVKSQGLERIFGVANQCREPVSPGPCRAFIPSFYYNPLTATCDCFIFGGCQANNNKFARLDECMNACSVSPQLQTISPTCIRIFGAEDSNFVVTPRPISPRPVAFSTAKPLLIVTNHPAVPVVTAKVIPTTVGLATAAPTTSTPIKPAALGSIPTSNNAQNSETTIKQGDLTNKKNDHFEGTSIIGSIFSQDGVSGQTTITIGKPVSIGRRRRSTDVEDDI